MFTPSFTPGVNTLLFRRMEEQTENLTPGDNFTPSRGQNLHLGEKFATRGEVKNEPQGRRNAIAVKKIDDVGFSVTYQILGYYDFRSTKVQNV
jgi:hypothetical protein